ARASTAAGLTGPTVWEKVTLIRGLSRYRKAGRDPCRTMTEHAAQRRTTEPNYVLPVLDFFARMGSAEAIVHGERRYTYAEPRAAVLAMAAALAARGVRGDMTAVAVTRNHPESIILLLALHLLGCRAGFVAADAPREGQRAFIERAGADV